MICAVPEPVDVRIGSRDAERVSVSAPVEAISGGNPLLARIHDLCITGARIETRRAQLEAGDAIRLRLPLTPAEQVGEVVWVEGSTLGVRFSEPLHPAAFRILAKVMQPPKEPGSATGACYPVEASEIWLQAVDPRTD